MKEIKQLLQNRCKQKKIPWKKMSRGRASAALEGYNSYLLGYCPKKYKSGNSYEARMQCARNDWNESHNIPEYQNWRHDFLKMIGVLP